MKLKLFQKQDLARAAVHDGLILSWDTGLGKTWALFLYPLLKLGYSREPIGLQSYMQAHTGRRKQAAAAVRLRPKGPVLIVAPGDLHQQIADEAWEQFGIVVFPLDSQDTFKSLACSLHSASSNLDEQGRPILAPDFYITSYTQLTTNGVNRLPSVQDWPDIVALRQLLCLKHGTHVPLSAVDDFCREQEIRWPDWDSRPDFATTCEFWAWRGVYWRDLYSKFGTDPATATLGVVQKSFDEQQAGLAERRDQEGAEKELVKLQGAFDTLKMLVTDTPDPSFAGLGIAQQDFVTRYFLAGFLQKAAFGNGESRGYEKLSNGAWRTQAVPGARAVSAPAESGANASDNDPPCVVSTRHIKCVHSPSLSDFACNAFRCVVVDEGVKMKGANTYVGAGVRQMNPEYRLVLTATPVKNRVPDLFWLAHWATGGKDEAHARFPYKNDPSEQTKFAETFMVSECNLTRLADAKEHGGKAPAGRYSKLTAEVCNIHRLWKLLGPIVLRRRKDDCGEDIPPKVRRVIRCKMGTQQADVYQYHMQCAYTDINDEEAIGARLQALRIAAADPTSTHLHGQLGDPTKPCRCTFKPVPPDVQTIRLNTTRQQTLQDLAEAGLSDPAQPIPATIQDRKRARALLETLGKVDEELASPVQRYDRTDPKKDCPVCHGKGELPLPHISGQPFIPKHASVLNLVHEILARGEQVLIGAAFNDPLDRLSEWLTEAGVRHLKLDGRTSQKKRGQQAAIFKRGRVKLPAAGGGETQLAMPVMLAGVECMAEGHSFHLANNVILLAYSWALDKFLQIINRVHRMTSPKPVNVYVVICDGTIDRKLESLLAEKNESSELVLDGRLMGERSEEINLAQLLQVAQREFDPTSDTLDEGLIHAQWPALRDRLSAAMQAWDDTCEVASAPALAAAPQSATAPARRRIVAPSPRQPAMLVANRPPAAAAGGTRRTVLRRNPLTGRMVLIEQVTRSASQPPAGAVPKPKPVEQSAPAEWQSALRPESNQLVTAGCDDLWKLL